LRTRLAGSLVTLGLLSTALQAHAAPKYATYHVNYLNLTPISAKVTNSVGQFSTPLPGQTFLVVSFYVANKDDVEVEVQPNDLSLIADGQSLDEDDLNTPTHPLVNTILEPGAKYVGGVTFDITPGTRRATLVWAPAPPELGGIKYPTHKWKLKF
jgi:hypothetical protein